jgi:hypothetical protein
MLTFDCPPAVPVAELLVALYFLGSVPLARCLITEHTTQKAASLTIFVSSVKELPRKLKLTDGDPARPFAWR